MKDRFEGNRFEPYTRLPLRLLRSKETRDIISSPEFIFLLYLESWIIRSPKATNGKLNLYDRYYKKQNLLAARWSIEELSKKFDVSKRTIIRWTKKLKNLGFIKIDKITKNRTHYNVYILGEHDDSGHNETRYYITELNKIEAKKTRN